MDASQLLLNRLDQIHKVNIPRLLDPLTDEQIRMRPRDDVNSIAWLVWHMARCKDVGNRLVTGCSQVLDEGDWMGRMNIPLRIMGTGMSDEEVAALSRNIEISALRAYLAAVAERTKEVIESMTPEQLDEEIDPEHMQRVLRDEGVLGANAEWVGARYSGHVKGSMLAHLGITHNFGHVYEAFTVRGLIGVRSRPEDGKERAVPEWQLSDLPV